MNLVKIPESAFMELNKKIWVADPKMILKYTNLTTVALKDFHVMAETHKTSFVDMDIQIIPVNDLENGVMSDIVGGGHVIHYTNYYDKKDPHANLHKLKTFSSEDFAKLSIYVRPQFVQKNDDRFLDLYVEPAFDDEVFRNLADDQKHRRAYFALLLLDYVDSRIKKDKHQIKKLMPTPEQKERADKTGEVFSTAPIKIKDISIQYIYVPHESRKYQRHCEAWGVRGHYRHYKSGKVVFIQPHVKGKGKLKTTQYIIGG